VLFAGNNAQDFVMSLGPGEEIGREVHWNVDKFRRIEQGGVEVVFNEKQERPVRPWFRQAVPQRDRYIKTLPLKLYTLYYPPNYPDGAANKTKAKAERAEAVEHSQGGLVVCVHTQ
jgi:hypothetical protein